MKDNTDKTGTFLSFIDLDGTLVPTDTLWESILQLLRQNLLLIFLLPLWIFAGRSKFKHEVAKRVSLKVDELPYDPTVIAHIEKRKAEGAEIILATAAHTSIAQAVANHLGVFDAVIASTKDRNLKGKEKLREIEKIAQGREFEYLGNGPEDLPIWAVAHKAGGVNLPPKVHRDLAGYHNDPLIFSLPAPRWKVMAKAARVHQWAKNSLLFVPALLAHSLSLGALSQLVAAFFSFSFIASTVYLFNDIIDIEHDRVHPAKKLRPLASGRLPIPTALFLLGALALASFAIAGLLLPPEFMGILVLYLLANYAYSRFLKKVVMADVLVLAGFYTLRLLAGGVAVDVALSAWLLMFSLFFFLGLAFIKRYSEIERLKEMDEEKVNLGRGYQKGDDEIIRSMGPATSYLSVLVFSLYIYSEPVQTLYSDPLFLWGIPPLLLYWVSRMWILAHRGEVDDDPVIFAIKDSVSYITGVLVIIAVLLSV